MQSNLRTVGTWGAVLLLPTILIASPPPQTTKAVSAGNQSQVGVSACAASIADQTGPGCLQASSTPTQGLLFPYPGTGNTFSTSSVVAGGINNAATGAFSTIAGGRDSMATQSGSTISGGGDNDASGSYSTVSGGSLNEAAGGFSTVGGGNDNQCSGFWATVAGGYYNRSPGFISAVGGGWFNLASGSYATVAGGYGNYATGPSAVVPGGSGNRATGTFSFAAGRGAKADHDGAFVWADTYYAASSKDSSRNDEFNVYASGGTRIFSNATATTGVLLAPGGGSWTSVSDRSSKENITRVDPKEVLERLAEIPVSTWNYKEQDDGIRHMGPMAQDFYAAFGLGLGDKTIDTIDPDGVALAAIQGLKQEKDAELAELRTENAQLRADLEELREALGTLMAR